MNTPEYVILVDAHDRELGLMEKMEAHRTGALHRAFSVFLYNTKGELLLQQRAFDKYHSGGLWTNTCCSHPRFQESLQAAAQRRLKEEMGIETTVVPAFHFIYQTPFENGLCEHELDHVFTGMFQGEPRINTAEVAAWRWISPEALLMEMELFPDTFTYWFKEIYQHYLRQYKAA